MTSLEKSKIYCPICRTEADRRDRSNDYECTNPSCELRYFSLWTIKDKTGYYHKTEKSRSESTIMFGGIGIV